MLKTAVVGCGLIATRKFLPILTRLKADVSLVAMSDLDQATLSKAATQFPQARPYSDTTAMLTNERPDVVIVCTPPASHTALVTQALRAGAHVLVEKPMALTARDCAAMTDVAIECKRKLGVMHNQVFNPAFEAACDAVEKGRIGQFLGMRVFLLSSVHDMTDDAKHWAHRLPGGMAGETAPHALYLSLALLRNVRDVQVRVSKQRAEFEWCIADDVRIDLIADNGISSICLMYGSNQTAGDVEIVGTEGVLRVDLQTRVMTELNRTAPKPLISSGALITSVASNLVHTAWRFSANGLKHSLTGALDGHYVGVKRFIEHVARGTEYRATGAAGRDVAMLMETVAARMTAPAAQHGA